MLKIKSNINEFTIIFSEKIGKKINAKKFSVQPSLFNTLFLFQPFAFFLSALHHPFLFLFVFQPLTFASALLFFSFGSRVPFFSAQTFFNFSAQTFFSFSSATLLFFFFSALFFSTFGHYVLPFFNPSV